MSTESGSLLGGMRIMPQWVEVKGSHQMTDLLENRRKNPKCVLG